MKEPEYLHFINRSEFRNWLQKYHDLNTGIWMIFYKKHTTTPTINYSDALEEALCFGWIDSLIKKIDNNKYARKFTPRTNTKKWSEINKKKVIGLIRNGKMTQAGLIKIDEYLRTGTISLPSDKSEPQEIKEPQVPGFITEALISNEPAFKNFNNLAPTYQRHFVLWITSAKKEETVRKRLQESIGLLKENKKLGLK